MHEAGGVDPRIGATLAGKYRIVRLIGRGAMGAVYEAQNVSIGRRVALKLLATESLGDATLARFHREARAIGAIESAHIVQVLDTGETEDGAPFLVMELLDGESLGARLARERTLGVPVVLGFAAQALRGLRRAHAAGFVHRDLKPENLLLVKGDDDGTVVKIVDFGLAKRVATSGGEPASGAGGASGMRLTMEGSLVGTPLYMSPEQLEARADVDQRTDLWSMGAILYEALAGEPPFPETSYGALFLAVATKSAPDVRDRAPKVPAKLAAAIGQALARDRAARFQSADDFLKAIVEIETELREAERREELSARALLEAARSAKEADRATPAPRASWPAPVRVSEAKMPPPPDASAPTMAGSTMWLSAAANLSLWRGDVGGADRLRIEVRDGSLVELRLTPVGTLKLGRAERVGDEVNDLVYPDVASRLAAVLRHDGTRWWLKRRDECSVPVQVGSRSLSRNEEAPLTHGAFVLVGGMRATFVDRRYMTPTVPAGAVDPSSGLLGRAGIEQETAAFLERHQEGGLLLVRATRPPETALSAAGPQAGQGREPLLVKAAMALHRSDVVAPSGVAEESAVLLVSGDNAALAQRARSVEEALRAEGLGDLACGYWLLSGEAVGAGREVEMALASARSLGLSDMVSARVGAGGAIALRDRQGGTRVGDAVEVLGASGDQRRTTLLFAIEEQSVLRSVGAHILPALEQELTAVVASHAGQGAIVALVSPGVVAASVPKKTDAATVGSSVQCDWHGRPPVMDGKMELWRTLSWEILHAPDPSARATDLSRECNDPHGVLSALAGGLPYPIAGRVQLAVNAGSAIERVKLLFDVLEGTWRFMATALVGALFSKRVTPGENPPGFDPMLEFYRRMGTRDGLALGSWRELARTAAKGFPERDDPFGTLARDVLGIKLAQNQTFEQLSNLMQAERNNFAHGYYSEARAAADLPEFEQMTRTFLRALRPLCAWTLVTVDRTEPDLYGDVQTVEFIDHTGPVATGTRRRIGLNSPARLANVAYLARFRDGVVLPLDPLVRRMVHDEKVDLYWMDHLPRSGTCHMSLTVGSGSARVPCDVRRLPPILRMLIERAAGG
ncbi:MAG: FHA domain-containing serine/threonine-protein kinase [Polyangiaceae bacterium]